MIELYTAPTGNGFRASIAVAESGLPYTARVLDLFAGEQRQSWLLALNPLGQIPVIVDRDGPEGHSITLSQSSAIMLYLAEKTGRNLPAGGAERVQVLERYLQVCTDVAAINATMTLATNEVDEPDAPTLAYFEQLLRRHFAMFDRLLEEQSWLCANLSIADFALYPNVVRRSSLIEAWGLAHLSAWQERMAELPGVALGMRIPVMTVREEE